MEMMKPLFALLVASAIPALAFYLLSKQATARREVRRTVADRFDAVYGEVGTLIAESRAAAAATSAKEEAELLLLATQQLAAEAEAARALAEAEKAKAEARATAQAAGLPPPREDRPRMKRGAPGKFDAAESDALARVRARMAQMQEENAAKAAASSAAAPAASDAPPPPAMPDEMSFDEDDIPARPAELPPE